jgi:hypothetical protein
LEKWMQLLAGKQIDKDEFGWLVESQKAAAQMEALQKTNAGSMQVEKFRDSVFQIIITTAVPRNHRGCLIWASPGRPMRSLGYWIKNQLSSDHV